MSLDICEEITEQRIATGPSSLSCLSSAQSNLVISSNPLHKSSPNIKSGQYFVPIVFKDTYDVHFFKLENVHPFDCKKWGKIASFINEYFCKKMESHLRETLAQKPFCKLKVKIGKKRLKEVDIGTKPGIITLLEPDHMISDDELTLVHSVSFVRTMNTSKMAVIRASEVVLLAALPMFLVRRKLLEPLRWQVSGSVLAGFLALQYGYAINLGGGFHHCSAASAGGFCLYADISLTIRYLWGCVNHQLNVLIVDLDAHQGNGHENDVNSWKRSEQKRVYIFDMFNGSIYPGDENAKSAINRTVQLRSHTKDAEYLKLLKYHLNESFKDFHADLIVYNAGTDILAGDPLGCLSISAQGIISRDEIVFTAAKERKIPIVMVTSGGYQQNNARIIANSIENLFDKKIISIYKR